LLPWAENQPWAVSVPCSAAFGFISLQVEILFQCLDGFWSGTGERRIISDMKVDFLFWVEAGVESEKGSALIPHTIKI